MGLADRDYMRAEQAAARAAKPTGWQRLRFRLWQVWRWIAARTRA